MSLSAKSRSAAFWTLDRLKGGPVRRHLQDLEACFNDPSEMRRRRDSRLASFLEHATATTPFYQQFKGCRKLEEFPVIQKATVRRDFDAFFSSAFSRDDLVPMTTSGSYGTPFTFHLTRDKKNRQRAEIIYFNRWAGYDVGTRHAYVRVTKTKPPFRLFLQNEVLMNPSNSSRQWLERQREILRRGDIRVIMGYPSSIGAIAEVCRAHGDTPRDFAVRGVIAGAEPLHDDVREKIQAVFGCPPVSRYSTEEFGVLAHERPGRREHVCNFATFIIEVLALDADTPVGPGELGRIVVTDYYSHAMPLIRYETGDLSTWVSPPSDSDGSPELGRIEGRQIESIFATSGHRVSPFAINGSMRDQQGIVQFQFIQFSEKDYTLKLVVMPTFAEEELIKGRLVDLLGADARVTVERVDSIPPLPSGKRPYILNRMSTTGAAQTASP